MKTLGFCGAAVVFAMMAGGVAAGDPVPVTVDNFVRAATDIEFRKYIEATGGVNKWDHVPGLSPIDRQHTIRSNRDTIYSLVVADLAKGATLTIPEAGNRYISAMVVNQDHYINDVFHGGGTFDLTMDKFDTRYVMIIMRLLVDAQDPEDLAAVQAIQAGITLDAGSSGPFDAPDYNMEEFQALLNSVLEVARFTPDASVSFGKKEDVDAVRHFLGTASGWGGLPDEEAFYLNVEPGLPVGEYKIEVPGDVPVGAFWSVSLYNSGGFFEANDRDAYVVNSIMGDRNDDDTVTVHLGGCDDDRINCLPIMEGWNYLVRFYQPGPEILDGSWVFPAAQPVE